VATKRQNPAIKGIAHEQDELVADFRHDIVLNGCCEARLLQHCHRFSCACLGTTHYYREAIGGKPLLADDLVVVDDDRGVVPQQGLMGGSRIEGESFRKSCEFAENRNNDSCGLLVRHGETSVTSIGEWKRISDETENRHNDCPDESNQKQPQGNAHRTNLLFQRCYHDSLVARAINLLRTIPNKLMMFEFSNFLQKSQEAVIFRLLTRDFTLKDFSFLLLTESRISFCPENSIRFGRRDPPKVGRGIDFSCLVLNSKLCTNPF